MPSRSIPCRRSSITDWASARCDVGRFDDALAAFRQAIEIDPTMPRPYVNIGDVYAYGFGRFDTAMPLVREGRESGSGQSRTSSPALPKRTGELGDDAEASDGSHQSAGASARGPVHGRRGRRFERRPRGDMRALKASRNELRSWIRRHVPAPRRRPPQGRLRGARARYAKAFPELFAKDRLRRSPIVTPLQRSTWRSSCRQPARPSEPGHSSIAAKPIIGRSRDWDQRLRDLGRRDPRVARREGQGARSACAKPSGPAGVASGATTATSTPTSPRSATSPNSRPSSPTSSATWRSSALALAARPKDAPLELTDASR